MVLKIGFSHKSPTNQEDMSDGLKLKPVFNHLWTEILSSLGQLTDTDTSNKANDINPTEINNQIDDQQCG
jgi:hypothetical protein